jgi:hypothetical protein
VAADPTSLLLFSHLLRKAEPKEKAARAITGRLVSQLPTRRQFHRTADFGGAAAPKGDGSGPCVYRKPYRDLSIDRIG